MGATGGIGIGIETGNLGPLKGRSGLKGNCRTFEKLQVTGSQWAGEGAGVREGEKETYHHCESQKYL